MALSTDTRNDINEWLGNICNASSVNVNDMGAVLECLYDNWDIVINRDALDTELGTQRATAQGVINAQQKVDLEAQGFTVTEP